MCRCGLDLLGQLAGDARERRFRLGQVAALIPDLREEEPRAIVQRGLHGLREHALEDLAGEPMLAVDKYKPPSMSSDSAAWCGISLRSCAASRRVSALK